MLQPVPHDVIVKIVQEAEVLCQEDDRSMVDWVSNASLISHSWTTPCQAWLFSQLTLEHEAPLPILRPTSPSSDSGVDENVPPFVTMEVVSFRPGSDAWSLTRLRFLESRPDLAAMVTTLRLSKYIIPGASEELIADLFPNVIDIIIVGLQQGTSSANTAMVSALDRPIHMTYGPTFPLQFPLLKKLDMYGAGADFVHPVPFRLTSLSLSGTNTFIRGFLHKVCGEESPSVHTIREVKLLFGWEEPNKEVLPICLESVFRLKGLKLLDLRCNGYLMLNAVPDDFLSRLPMLATIIVQVQNPGSSTQDLLRLLHHAQVEHVKHLLIRVYCLPRKQHDRADAQPLEYSFRPLGKRVPPLAALSGWKISPTLQRSIETVRIEFDVDDGTIRIYDTTTFRRLFGMAGSEEVMSMYALGDGTLDHDE